MRNNFWKKFLFVGVVAFCSLEVQAKEVIKVGSEFVLAPFSYLDNGHPSGFEVDLLREIAAINDWEIDYQKLAWKQLFILLENGRIDLAMSSLFKTPQREEIYTLTNPYLINKDAVMFSNPDLNIQSNEDLLKLKIAGRPGGKQAKFLFSIGYPKENFVSVDTVFLGFKAVAMRKVDGVVSHELVLKNFSKRYPVNFKTYILDDGELGEVSAIAKKGNQDLVDKFNQALEKLKKNGKYKELEKKWDID